MIAVIGIPGSMHHRWERFTRAQYGTDAEARKHADQWLEEARQRLQEQHPAAWPQPTEILSERRAAKIRYQDGFRAYPTDPR